MKTQVGKIAFQFVETLLIDAGDQDLFAHFHEFFDDAAQLLQALALPEDDLGNAPAQLAVKIELELRLVAEGKILQKKEQLLFG